MFIHFFGNICPKIAFSGNWMIFISLFSWLSGIGKNCPSPKSKPNKRYNLYPAHSTMNSREIGAQYNLFWHLLATKRNWGIYSERGKIILQTHHWTYLVDYRNLPNVLNNDYRGLANNNLTLEISLKSIVSLN